MVVGMHRHPLPVVEVPIIADAGARHVHDVVAIEALDDGVLGIAETGCTFHDGVEDGLELGGHAADDSEDIAGGRVVLQRLGQIAAALVQFLEEASVLDGDDGLIGERLQECDLLFGVRTNRAPRQTDDPDGLAATEEWHADLGADDAAIAPGGFASLWELVLMQDVLDSDGPALDKCSPGYRHAGDGRAPGGVKVVALALSPALAFRPRVFHLIPDQSIECP